MALQPSTTPLRKPVLALILFETANALYLSCTSSLSAFAQYLLLSHVVAGILLLPLAAAALWRHWVAHAPKWNTPGGRAGLLGIALLAASLLSGIGVTVAGVEAGTRWLWWVHTLTSYAAVAAMAAHLAFAAWRQVQSGVHGLSIPRALAQAAIGAVLVTIVPVAAAIFWPPPPTATATTAEATADGPFGNNNLRTVAGGYVEVARLGSSRSCAACHKAIYDQWNASAHRWSAIDPLYRQVERAFAKARKPDATRYCAACHDPASLLAGAISGPRTADHPQLRTEGASCILCHSIQSVDATKGNGSIVVASPQPYLFEDMDGALPQWIAQELIRWKPDAHRLAFARPITRDPVVCSGCHKQNLNESVNGFGWVRLQNQYDSWRTNKWNPPDHPERAIRCQECHMRLEPGGDDPVAKRPDHYGLVQSHRFLGANQAIPTLFGDKEQVRLTEHWIRGEIEVPEIADRWLRGPIFQVDLEAPARVAPGATMQVAAVTSNRKAGHEFPTGPLDLIETWLEITVTDARGRVIFHNGGLNAAGDLDPNAHKFVARGVDWQYHTIMRHNLWEQIGIISRRNIVPGNSDRVAYLVHVPSDAVGPLRISSRLRYRKFTAALSRLLYNGYMFPITDIASATAVVSVGSSAQSRK